jgi:hypothetical protein
MLVGVYMPTSANNSCEPVTFDSIDPDAVRRAVEKKLGYQAAIDKLGKVLVFHVTGHKYHNTRASIVFRTPFYGPVIVIGRNYTSAPSDIVALLPPKEEEEEEPVTPKLNYDEEPALVRRSSRKRKQVERFE